MTSYTGILNFELPFGPNAGNGHASSGPLREDVGPIWQAGSVSHAHEPASGGFHDFRVPVEHGQHVHRKRGRPRKVKEVVLGPKQRRGRPPKVSVPLSPLSPKIKRRPGRPRKNQDAGGIVIDFGVHTVPGSASLLHRTGAPPNHGFGPRALAIQEPLPVGVENDTGSLPVGTGPHVPVIPSLPAAGNPHQAMEIGKGLENRVIPPEDPQQAVNIGDEEEDGEDGNGDGIGEEDADDEADEDEADDEDRNEDNHEDNRSQQANKPPRVRRPLPPWLQSAFEATVSDCEKRDGGGLPSIYARGQTFWTQPPSTSFLLNNHNPSPPLLFNPRFFVWDPQAIVKNIPCPYCKRVLHRDSVLKRPRRCVDVNSTFWMIGYRYRCRHCRHPKTQKYSVSWRSWDPRILAVLPKHIASEFPAHLTHRSGISKVLFSWLRSCFQSGMGAKQFSDAVLVQHLLRFDELQLQYLDCIVARSGMDQWRGKKYKPFLCYDDTSEDGYHGFVPSGQWFRDVYDNFIEEHRADFSQHMGMLTAEICAVDHSHKIVKHIAKVNGERVFNGLLTVTNEKGEIRSCNLVASKAQSQFELALKRMRESLEMYGHRQPELFYTDNMADKSFLESSFPSLRRDVVPVEKHGHLEAYVLPADIQILLRREESSINAALSTILEKVPVEAEEPELIIGYDSEWNFTISDNGSVERGQIATIQIAFEKRVYILQISEMVRHQKLPEKLVMLLRNPRVRKVGRMVSSDLKQLQASVGSSVDFCGGLDLAGYAKERHATSSARCSLSDLCAAVLGKCLNKNVSERTSGAWEHEHLTAEQQHYAACDAYVPLLLYDTLSKISVPQPLPTIVSSSIPVLLYSTDNTTLVARGSTSPTQGLTSFEGVKVNKNHILIDISEVLVPAALITSHQKRSLSSFGPPPFSVVYLRSHVRVYDPTSLKLISTSNEPASNEVMQVDAKDSDHSIQDVSDSSEEEDGEGMGDLIRAGLGGLGNSSACPSVDAEVDMDSRRLGEKTLAGLAVRKAWSTKIRSRVLKDPFHIFNMLRISASHGLRKEFGRALRDALFVPVKEDQIRISSWGKTLNPPLSFDDLKALKSEWLWKRCRRVIPPAEEVSPIIEDLAITYGPLKDASTQLPLFNQQNWKVMKQIIENVRSGYVSDPPGIPLFTIIGLDAKAGSLPIYRCSRGTNFTEGGVHTHLRPQLPKHGASVRHANARIADFVLLHNLRVGTMNSTGRPYKGHSSIWLINQLQELQVYLHDSLIDPSELKGWVNGNLYLPTKETIGILPVPDDVRQSCGLSLFVEEAADKKQTHLYLARMQGTRKAILPVHTSAEHDLFQELMASNSSFNSVSKGPIFALAVKVWNELADKKPGIFYKLEEQLKTYYSAWQTRLNVRQSLSMTSDRRRPVTKAARDPARANFAPQAQTRPRNVHDAKEGFNVPHHLLPLIAATPPTPPNPSVPSNTAASLAPGTSTIVQDTTNNHLADANRMEVDTPPSSAGPPLSVANLLARERVANNISQSTTLPPPARPPRTRTCQKCFQKGCPGARNRELCKGACADCGKRDCKGRNARKKGKRCDEAWP